MRAGVRACVSASPRDAGEAGAPSTAASSSRDEFSMSIVKSIGAPANETGMAPPRPERPRAESEAHATNVSRDRSPEKKNRSVTLVSLNKTSRSHVDRRSRSFIKLQPYMTRWRRRLALGAFLVVVLVCAAVDVAEVRACAGGVDELRRR